MAPVSAFPAAGPAASLKEAFKRHFCDTGSLSVSVEFFAFSHNSLFDQSR